jgi:hypothetical protein
MCYACTQCGKCGKFTEGSPFYVNYGIPCLKCGAEVEQKTGICIKCGNVAFTPLGNLRLVPQGKGQ